MTENSNLPPPEKAKRFRELARHARAQAARSKRVPRFHQAYISMAGRWEQLALDAEEEEQVSVFLEKAW